MKDIFFRIEDIEKLASSRVFERGEDYYESGYVGKITKKGDIFNGTVSGSYRYKVSLDISKNKVAFKCSCPYDDYGLCKHCVAFSLAIINGEYKEEKTDNVKTFTKEEFEKRFKSVEDNKKLKFLKEILDKDTNLQSQFINYTETKTKKVDSISILNKVKTDIFSDLSSLDFDEISGEDYYENYYDEENPSIEEANEMIEDVFKKYYKKSEYFIQKGDLINAINIILGMYEGSQDLPELDNNEYYVFDDAYNHTVQEILQENINKLSNEISNIIKSDKDVISSINLIISRFHYYENVYKPKKNDYGMKIAYYPEDFNNLFLSIISNEKTALHLYELILENDLECLGLAFVILKISELTKNEKLWIETAESFAEADKEISKKLLDRYKSDNKESDFNRIAEISFEKFPYEFDLYLIDNLNKNTMKNLYVKCLKHYIKSKHSISHYNDLREYLPEKEKNNYLDEISKGYNYVFYVKLLEIEKYYDKILSFVIENKNSGYFDKLIEPIINIYHQDCFDIIKDKCQKSLTSPKRNRDTYKEMAKWIKLMKQIKGKEKETNTYILELYNHKPNLPALKEEMTNAKLF